MLTRLKRWITERAMNWWVDESTGMVNLLRGSTSKTAAENLSAVHCAVEVISGAAMTMPIHVYRRISDSERDLATDHPAYHILHKKPNTNQTASVFKGYMIRQRLLRGNAYALKARTNGGRLFGLIPLHPDNVTPQLNEDGELEYIVSVRNGYRETVPQEDMVHIKGPSEDGLVGLSVLSVAARSFELANVTEDFSKKYFTQGTTVSGKVTVPEKFSKERAQKIKASLNRLYSGVENSHGIFVAQYGVDFEPFNVTGKDAMFLESRQFSIEDVARWFNIQPHKLKHWAGSQTYGNLESENRSFIEDTMLPHLTAFEEELDAKVLEGDTEFYTEFSTDARMRGDSAARASFYGAMTDRGIMSVNEVRRRENMPPIPGGDEHNKPLNMGTVGKPDPGQDDSVRSAFRPLLRHAFEQLARVESDRLARMAGRDPGQVVTWARRFFNEEHRGRALQVLTPVLAAYGSAIGEQIDTDQVVNEYLTAQCNRVQGTSDLAGLATEIRATIRETI